jgi:hypothetical protein
MGARSLDDRIGAAMEADLVSQQDGYVFATVLPDTEVVMTPFPLLQIVLAAIKARGNADELDLAAKVCMSHLGRARFA